MISLVFCKLCRYEAFDLTPSMLQLIIPIVSLSGSEFLAVNLGNLEVLSRGLESENGGDLP